MGSLTSKEQNVATAIENQDAAELRTILKDLSNEEIRNLCKAYVPFDENQCTILHYATWQGNPDLLAPLLDYADDLELRDALGWTPLMTAVNGGSRENVNLLLARGAKVDCDWSEGISLVADAMHHNDLELVSTLIDHGAKVTPTDAMIASGEDLSSSYLLHFAVDDGLQDMAKLLIEKGRIPLNTVDVSGWTPLHLAAGHNNVELIKLLLEKGAELNPRDKSGNTPLAWAREFNSTAAVNELQTRGAIADKEWHGSKPELKVEEEYDEEAAEGDYEQGVEEQWQGATSGVGFDRFEIEVESAKSKGSKSPNGKGSLSPDALQRHPVSTKAELY